MLYAVFLKVLITMSVCCGEEITSVCHSAYIYILLNREHWGNSNRERLNAMTPMTVKTTPISSLRKTLPNCVVTKNNENVIELINTPLKNKNPAVQTNTWTGVCLASCSKSIIGKSEPTSGPPWIIAKMFPGNWYVISTSNSV